MEVHIITNAISRRNGGSSSIVDLANNLTFIGNDVFIYTAFGFLDKYIYKTTDVDSKLKVRTLESDVFQTRFFSVKKKLLNKLISFFGKSNLKKIKNAVIIDALGLPFEIISILQSNHCSVLYNHAGSPNAMMKYFGTNGVKRGNLDIEKEKYLKMINYYDYILFQSPTQAADLKEMAGWEKNKTLVLRPSVSTKDISNISESKNLFDENGFNVVIVGSVQERKGQHLLPRISHAISNERGNVVFHVVGNIVNEVYKNKIIEETINLNQSDKIIFHGFKPNYLEYIKGADIVLQLSEEEGVSRILREAMALEKVILSFRLDGTNDLLVDGEDCLLSDYGDIASIISDILKIYEDRNLFTKLSMKAKENFENKYSKSEYLKNLNILLSNIKVDCHDKK